MMFRLRELIVAGCLVPALFGFPVTARAQSQAQSQNAVSGERQTDEPVLREYRGIKIGMTLDAVHQKLGDPKEKSDRLDIYTFSDSETAQIYYDESKKVMAIAVIYTGRDNNAPTAKAVLGTDVQPRPDGSAYLMIRYPKAGYWVSYSRTAGEEPIVTVTMQRMVP
jgi:hypothetical protein